MYKISHILAMAMVLDIVAEAVLCFFLAVFTTKAAAAAVVSFDIYFEINSPQLSIAMHT